MRQVVGNKLAVGTVMVAVAATVTLLAGVPTVHAMRGWFWKPFPKALDVGVLLGLAVAVALLGALVDDSVASAAAAGLSAVGRLASAVGWLDEAVGSQPAISSAATTRYASSGFLGMVHLLAGMQYAERRSDDPRSSLRRESPLR